MYKMMIIDSEKNSQEVIKRIIENHCKEIEITGIGETGQEALELAEIGTPDILMISVRLKDISGLDVVRRIRKKNKEVYVILDSVYDYYDFVKEGLELKVFDYMLKPINEGLLLPVIKNILIEIKEKEKQRVQKSEQDERLKLMHEFAEYSFLYGTLFNERPGLNLKRYIDFLGLGEKGFVLNIEIEWGESEPVKLPGRFNERLYSVIKRVADCFGANAVGPRIMQRIVVFVSVEAEKYEKMDVKPVKELAGQIADELEENLGLCAAVGIGRIRKTENLYDSYEEGLRSLRYAGTKRIVHIGEVEEITIDHENYIELENKMLDGVRFGKEEALAYLSELLDCLKPLKEQDVRNKIVEILVLACHEIRMGGQNENDYINYVDYFKEMLEVKQEDLWNWTTRKFEYIMKAARTGKNAKKSDTVRDALRYISEHFTVRISLGEVARYVGVTSQHLSKLFKEETGSNYVEYLTKLRIEEAKKFLKEGNKTVNEICYLVGYDDPNYFSRLFKKTVGISPTEFIETKPQINNNN